MYTYVVYLPTFAGQLKNMTALKCLFCHPEMGEYRVLNRTDHYLHRGLFVSSISPGDYNLKSSWPTNGGD